MTTPTRPEHVSLIEDRFALTKATKIDTTKGLIEDVLLCGLSSPSKRREYTPAALSAAVRLYEGAPVNLDHHVGKTPPTAARFGRTQNARYVEGQGIRGDVRYNTAHPWATSFAWFAENDPGALGFSHHADGKCKTSGGKEIVESIVSVRSVDLVTDPATTNGLFEDETTARSREMQERSTPKGDQMELKDLTAEMLQKERPDLCRNLRESADESARLVAAEAAVKKLTEEKDRLEVANALASHRSAVDVKLAEAKLPPAAITDVFRKQLYEAKDAAAVDVLIVDRKTLVNVGPISKTKTLAEGTGSTGLPDAKQLASQLRG